MKKTDNGGQLAVIETGSGCAGRNACATLAAGDEAGVAECVRQGWRGAQAGLVYVLRFGAMLIEVREWIGDRELGEIFNAEAQRRGDPPTPAASARQAAEGDGGKLDNLQQRISSSGHGGDRRSGTGLKAWLEKHCPEVHYKTAYGYMVAAEGLRTAARIAADVPLLSMMGEEPLSEARAEQARQRVFKAIAGGSLALMREAGRAGEPGPRGGARENATGRRALTPLEHAQAASSEIKELLGKMGAYMEGAKPGMLTVEERQWAATRMKDLAGRLISWQ